MMATATVPLLSDLSELLRKHVQDQPNRIAIGTSDLRTVITYRQLDDLIQSVKAQLCSVGLKRGDTVALVSDNSVEFVPGFLAVVSLGARIAPLNPALASTELGTRVSQLSAHAVLAPRHVANELQFAQGIPERISCWLMDLEGTDGSYEVRIAGKKGNAPAPPAIAEPNIPVASGDIALLLFTGGTTGTPKLVPLTHHNVAASIENISRNYALSPEDATLLVMPLFHGHGLIAGLLSTLASGGSVFLPSTGSFSAHLFWPDVVRLGVTWYTAVPTIHRILLNRADKEYPWPSRGSLRFIRSCSAPLDEELAGATAATFRAPVISAYGMTETSHQLSSNPLPSNGLNKMSSVGLATGVEIRIVGENGKDVTCSDVGEIWVRGATLTPGYLDNSEANAASFVEGWFRTGDLGNRDADGYIYLRGRIKEMINRAGEKISPSDIDAVLLSNPKVYEAASFGEPDLMYGERVQAAVILQPGTEATEDELLDYCRTKLSAHEVPDRIHILRDFPRTQKRSIDRHALAAQFAVRKTRFSDSGRES